MDSALKYNPVPGWNKKSPKFSFKMVKYLINVLFVCSFFSEQLTWPEATFYSQRLIELIKLKHYPCASYK